MQQTVFDLSEAIRTLIARRKTIALITLAFLLLGVVFALHQRKYYTSVAILAPENASGSQVSSGLLSFGSAMGVNLNHFNDKNSDAILTDFYPLVVSSPDFIVSLWNCPVERETGETMSYYEHFIDNRKTEKPRRSWLADFLHCETHDERIVGIGDTIPNTRHLTRFQDAVCNAMSREVECVCNDNGLLTITVRDVDPYVACTIADSVQSKLKAYITLYRTQKARREYEYVKQLTQDAREDYLVAQAAAATFADANVSVFKQKVISQREVLQNEFQIKYETYSSLWQQQQNALCMVEIATPVFTPIQRASVPLKPSSPSHAVYVLLYTLVGFFFALVYVLFLKDYLIALYHLYKDISSPKKTQPAQ